LLFGLEPVQLNAQQVVLHLAPLCFDASLFELWGPLVHGARCVLFPGRTATIEQLRELIQREAVSTLWLTAALFNTIVDQDPAALATISQLLIGGEPLSVEHVRRALDVLPKTQIFNGYGPTEGTTFTCLYAVPRPLGTDVRSIPIGRPIANTRVYILDQDLQPVPVGVPGELYLAGDGLARGYRNAPQATAERFVPNPFSKSRRSVMYKTGDIVRRLPNGDLEFSGRLDQQVKVRGIRIEPAEIAAALSAHPTVGAAWVQMSGDLLVGYVVPRLGCEMDSRQLRRFLAEKLPESMIPGRFVSIPALPLTSHGKVDRAALPVPAQCIANFSRDATQREDPLEARLAQIWQRVLPCAAIDRESDFFELGGHSLLALRLIHQIDLEFGRKLVLPDLLKAPTFGQMVDLMREEILLANVSQQHEAANHL
jgi:acyl-coenzyme A synthetase/AMP-(fatty) acid ligase